MTTLSKILDRIGGVLISPIRTFEIMIVEGLTLSEGVTVSILSLLGFTFVAMTVSTIHAPVTLTFILFFLIVTSIWICYIFTLHKIIVAIYKVPGLFKEFFTLSSYALASVIMVVPYVVLGFALNLLDNFTFGIAGIIIGNVWFVWFNILLWVATKTYYRIDKKQFLVALITSWIFLTILIVIGSLIFASIVTGLIVRIIM